MPKLYYTPTSCGAASFIAAYTARVNLEVEQVDIKTHQTSSGADYYKINPKGNVPCLVLDNGVVLNEGAAVLQYIADQMPNSIAPEFGTVERYIVINALNYIASEVHPSIGGLFYPNSEEIKNGIRGKANSKFTYMEEHFLSNNHRFLISNNLTIADLYLFIVLSWVPYVGLDISSYPKLKEYYDRMANLHDVKAGQARMAENPATVF